MYTMGGSEITYELVNITHLIHEGHRPAEVVHCSKSTSPLKTGWESCSAWRKVEKALGRPHCGLSILKEAYKKGWGKTFWKEKWF